MWSRPEHPLPGHAPAAEDATDHEELLRKTLQQEVTKEGAGEKTGHGSVYARVLLRTFRGSLRRCPHLDSSGRKITMESLMDVCAHEDRWASPLRLAISTPPFSWLGLPSRLQRGAPGVSSRRMPQPWSSSLHWRSSQFSPDL